MKRLSFIIVTVVMVMILYPVMATYPAKAETSGAINIFFDGNKLKTDVEPLVENGRVLIPLRAISEEMGFRVDWSPSAQVAYVFGEHDAIQVAVGGKIAYINDQPVELDVVAGSVNGRVMLPIRFVAEALGLEINWVQKNSYIEIKDKQRYFDQIQSLLIQGDLAGARRVALLAPKKNIQYDLETGLPELDKPATYYFPEGECLRYYVQTQDQLIYFSEVNGIFVVQWQTSLGGNLMGKPASTLTKYLATLSKGYTDEQGIRPLVTESLSYFEYIPEKDLLNLGQISPEGSRQLLDSVDWQEDQGPPIVEIPSEEISKRYINLMEGSKRPTDSAYLFSSDVPRMELTEAERAEIEKDWQENNFYNYEEMKDINRDFISYPLRVVYMRNAEGPPDLSELEPRFVEEYENALSHFTEEIRKSSGWYDFLAMGHYYDPSFSVLRAKSTENQIDATLVGHRFHFGFVPVILEVEMVKEGDKWVFTGMENVRPFDTIAELQVADRELYEQLVRILNYRR
ncbi:MAG: copper amine oxidase N-terminal domain-containing protein [Bacillota bacterium]